MRTLRRASPCDDAQDVLLPRQQGIEFTRATRGETDPLFARKGKRFRGCANRLARQTWSGRDGCACHHESNAASSGSSRPKERRTGRAPRLATWRATGPVVGSFQTNPWFARLTRPRTFLSLSFPRTKYALREHAQDQCLASSSCLSCVVGLFVVDGRRTHLEIVAICWFGELHAACNHHGSR